MNTGGKSFAAPTGLFSPSNDGVKNALKYTFTALHISPIHGDVSN